MVSGPPLPRRVGLVLGTWAAVGLVSAIQVWLASLSMGHATTFAAVAWWTVPVWLYWAPLTPAVAAVARRFPLERGRLAGALPVHFTAAVALALGHLGWWLAWTQWVSPYALEDRAWSEMYWLYVQSRFNVSFLVYWAILGAYFSFGYARRWRRSELDASRLEGQLSRARLDALRAQIRPHFLFNTLNAISARVARDPEGARHMIARLSDLMRMSLERDADQEIPLRDELEYVEVYLDIEQTRFGDRLRIEFDVDPEALDARVPNLVLQPLVENAVRHGVARMEGAGELRLTAARRNDRLAIRIENDAPADGETDGRTRTGLGLRNTRDRLERLYGADQRFDFQRELPGRAVAALEIPFRTDGEADR